MSNRSSALDSDDEPNDAGASDRRRTLGFCPIGDVSPLASCGVQELNAIGTSTDAAQRGARFEDVERSFNPAHKPHKINKLNHAGSQTRRRLG